MKKILLALILLTLTSCSFNISTENTNELNKEQVSTETHIDTSHLQSLSNTTYKFSVGDVNAHSAPYAPNQLDFENYNAFYVLPDEDKSIYLTFDCADDSENVAEILDILKKHDIKACFFLPGTFIESSPELVQRIIDEGHLVGNHTLTHTCLVDRPLEEIQKELSYNNQKLYELTGETFDPYLRYPKSTYNEQVLTLANELGYNSVFWSVSPTKNVLNSYTTPEELNNYIYENIHSGAIIRLHTSYDFVPQGLDEMITTLESYNYTFNTFDNLF